MRKSAKATVTPSSYRNPKIPQNSQKNKMKKKAKISTFASILWFSSNFFNFKVFFSLSCNLKCSNRMDLFFPEYLDHSTNNNNNNNNNSYSDHFPLFKSLSLRRIYGYLQPHSIPVRKKKKSEKSFKTIF
jgi:hypothetical protein